MIRWPHFLACLLVLLGVGCAATVQKKSGTVTYKWPASGNQQQSSKWWKRPFQVEKSQVASPKLNQGFNVTFSTPPLPVRKSEPRAANNSGFDLEQRIRNIMPRFELPDPHASERVSASAGSPEPARENNGLSQKLGNSIPPPSIPGTGQSRAAASPVTYQRPQPATGGGQFLMVVVVIVGLIFVLGLFGSSSSGGGGSGGGGYESASVTVTDSAGGNESEGSFSRTYQGRVEQKPKQGLFESDREFRDRVYLEGKERVIEDLRGEAPKQGFFESDDTYRSRIAHDANEASVEQFSGEKPNQGFFESNENYRERMSHEANESIVAASGGNAKQGFFETDDQYDDRMSHGANEAIIAESTGSAPKQGFFESDDDYKTRVNHEAKDIRASSTDDD